MTTPEDLYKPLVGERQAQVNVLAEIQRRAWQTSEDHGFHEAQRNLDPRSVLVIIAALRVHEAISRIIGKMRDVTPEEADAGRYELLLEDLLHVGLRSDRTVPLTTAIEQSVLVKLLLIHEEVSEATECAFEHLAGPTGDPVLDLSYLGDLAVVETNPDKPGKPEGFPSELADIKVRVNDCMESCGIDPAVELDKMDYNDTRERLHGRNI
jgi:hypothetical protein